MNEKSKFNVSDNGSNFADLNVLSASQSVDLPSKKQGKDDKSAKSSHAFGYDKGQQPKRNSGRKKRKSRSRSDSSSKEETVLIRHFVT